MRIIDIINRGGYSLSFEVFPPKTSDTFESIRTATEKIAGLKPSYMSVTYGAGGGTSEFTVSIAANLQKKFNVPALAHLTCVNSTHAGVRKQLQAMADAGIENVMALRGDILPDAPPRAEWQYHYASQLVEEIRDFGGFCIGGACYPEGHPESETQDKDIEYLKRKIEAGCEFLTTQMFFDNNILYNFLYKVREAGITVPIVAGIMPLTSVKQVERAVALSGNYFPRCFAHIVDRFGHDPGAMKQAGIAYATEQAVDLFANGVRAVHIYSMNHPSVAAKIQENLSEIIK